MKTCPDCGVKPNHAHEAGCDVERCSACGDQWISCQCSDHNPDEVKWEGLWPGVKECRELGFYCYWGPDFGESGWVSCDKSHPGATEDLNRWAVYQQQAG